MYFKFGPLGSLQVYRLQDLLHNDPKKPFSVFGKVAKIAYVKKKERKEKIHGNSSDRNTYAIFSYADKTCLKDIFINNVSVS